MTQTVNLDTFDTAVLNADTPVLVDFWAPWCGPCRAIAPVLEELSSDYEGRLTIAKINVDDNQPLAARYGVRSIPTLLLFRNGEVIETLIGAQPKPALSAAIDRALAANAA
ncbi:MAG: thioredoxin [Pseudomonadota bacterium]